MKGGMAESAGSKISQWKDTIYTSRRLLAIVWETDKILFIEQLFAVLVPAVIPFLNAYIFKLIIDLVVKSIGGSALDFQRFYFLLGILFAMQYLQSMAFSLQNYIVKILYMKMPITLYQQVLNKISTLDLKYFEDSQFRDTLQKVRESYVYRPLELTHNLFFLLQSFTQVVVALYAILKLNAFLAVLILVVAIPDFINQVYFSKFAWGIWSQRTPYRKKYDYLSNLLQRGENIKELKIFQLGQRFLKEISGLQYAFFNENKVLLRKQLGVNTIFNLLDTAVLTGVSAFIIIEAISRRITVGDISFYSSVIGNFNNGIGGLFRNLSAVFEDSLYVKSVFDLLDIKTTIIQPERAVKVNYRKTPKIEFKDVSFAYPGSKTKVLKNFSLIINPGEKVAFVGENGAGKTTLVKLLARFYDVDEGEILVNGVNLKELDLDSWYKAFGALFQDFNKYEYPVKDNVYFGKVWEKEDLGQIIEASKSAGAHEMINKFEQGYQQMLGKTFEGGLELSGGQWQKVALARGFFRSAPILVLDEPTAAIDAKAEAEIFNRVEKLSKDKTVIIISHRFSTVRNADKIYVVDGGKIAESGTHEELMKVDGQYAALFKLQAKGYR